MNDPAQRVRRATEKAARLEEQSVALRADVLRLEVEKKRLAEEVAFLSKHRDRIKEAERKAKARLEALNDRIRNGTWDVVEADAERNRRMWSERYEMGVA